MNKIIRIVCLKCGRANDKKKKKQISMWTDDCQMCGAKQVPCGDAYRDFGIFLKAL